jgi:hypothetical protein
MCGLPERIVLKTEVEVRRGTLPAYFLLVRDPPAVSKHRDHRGTIFQNMYRLFARCLLSSSAARAFS